MPRPRSAPRALCGSFRRGQGRRAAFRRSIGRGTEVVAAGGATTGQCPPVTSQLPPAPHATPRGQTREQHGSEPVWKQNLGAGAIGATHIAAGMRLPIAAKVEPQVPISVSKLARVFIAVAVPSPNGSKTLPDQWEVILKQIGNLNPTAAGCKDLGRESWMIVVHRPPISGKRIATPVTPPPKPAGGQAQEQ